MFNDDLTRAILDGRFEETDEGIFVPTSRVMVGGVFCYHKRGEPEEFTANLFVTEGLNYLLSAGLKAGTPSTTWFIAPFSGDVAVQATWTAVNFTTNSTEVTAYASATRPVWTGGSVASGTVNSFAAKAEIMATANGTIIRGAGIISASAKSATTGALLAASKFISAKTLDTDEILDIGYGLTLTAVV